VLRVDLQRELKFRLIDEVKCVYALVLNDAKVWLVDDYCSVSHVFTIHDVRYFVKYFCWKVLGACDSYRMLLTVTMMTERQIQMP